jgi:hypothetical protein
MFGNFDSSFATAGKNKYYSQASATALKLFLLATCTLARFFKSQSQSVFLKPQKQITAYLVWKRQKPLLVP